MILRPYDDSAHRIVGQSFVHGLSQGEAILGPLPESVRIVRLLQKEPRAEFLGFVNGATNETSFLDPRLNKLGIDLESYKQDLLEHGRTLLEHGRTLLDVSVENLQSIGIDVQMVRLR